MGESFSGYLNRRRTDTAFSLLATTDISVAEIAAALGFSDQFSFSHFFKRSIGRSPRKFLTDRVSAAHSAATAMAQMAYGGVAAAFLLVVSYWYTPRASALPEVDTITVRLVGGHVLASPLTASGYVVAQRQTSVASKGTGRLEYLGVKVGGHLAARDILFRQISVGQFDQNFGKNGVVRMVLVASVA